MKKTLLDLKAKIALLSKENKLLKLKKKQLEKDYGLLWQSASNKYRDFNTLPFLKVEHDYSHYHSKEKPLNFLIEGDIFHTLNALQRTNENNIDIVYADVSNVFLTNEKNTNLPEWLSLIDLYLYLIKNLLKSDGVVFISVCMERQAHLKMLMNKIFGEENFISNITWHNKDTNKPIINNDTEYILVYGKDITKITPVYRGGSVWLGEEIQREYMNKDNDERGLWRVHRHTKTKKQNPYEYAVNIKTGEFVVGAKAKAYSKKKYFYYNDRWRYPPETIVDLLKQDKVYIEEKEGIITLFQVKKFKSEEIPYTAPKSIIFKEEVNSLNSNEDLYSSEILNTGTVNYSKSVKLIKKLLRMINKKEAVVLDFFTRNGATGHAVMELNKEDGGNRQFILCTSEKLTSCSKEHQQFDTACLLIYQQLTRVIKKTPNNLVYLKNKKAFLTAFRKNSPTSKNEKGYAY